MGRGEGSDVGVFLVFFWADIGLVSTLEQGLDKRS